MSEEHSVERVRELELLAVLDYFAAELNDGSKPRLAAYLERYPQFADELIAFATGYGIEIAGPDTSDSVETLYVKPGELSAGSQRALAALFPDVTPQVYRSPFEASRAAAAGKENGLRAVAERPGDYVVRHAGLAALAMRRGITLERLATMTDLPVDVLLWLDSQDIRSAPDAVLTRVAEALRSDPHEVEAALSSSGGAVSGVSTEDVIAGLLAHPALSPEQREEWAKLLRGATLDER